jgi:hypothetical protein
MKRLNCIRFLKNAVPLCALLPFASIFFPVSGPPQTPEIRNLAGIEMKVDTADKDPALSVTVPDGSSDDRSFKILLPEHVTIRPHGQTEIQHLYIYDHDPASKAPKWKKVGS